MRPRSSETSRSSTRGGARTAASPGAPSAKKSLGLQLRGERDWQPAQRHRDGYLDRLPLIGYERIAA
jgi:hypothetical protein